MTLVVGLDLSLSSTGWALARSHNPAYETGTLQPRKHTGHERMQWLLAEICKVALTADLVVVEGPSYGSAYAGQRGHHERAGLWWLVTHHLWLNKVSVAVAPPTAVKKYATGKGNAGKDLVLAETVRRFADFRGGNDAADALILCALGAEVLGWPIAVMPAVHKQAVSAVDWPAVLPIAEPEPSDGFPQPEVAATIPLQLDLIGQEG